MLAKEEAQNGDQTVDTVRAAARPRTKGHAALRVLLVTTVAIFVVELGIMLLFHPEHTDLQTAFGAMLDASLLVIVLYPVLHFWVYRRLLRELGERERVEEALRKLHAQLEVRVTERTSQLSNTIQDLQMEVSQRKWAVEAMTLSEARTRAIFERAAIGMALVDMSGKIVESNEALYSMLGYREDELRGKAFTEITHPEDAALDWGLFQEMVQGKRDRFQIEKRYLSKDGAVVWGRLTRSLVKGADGEPQFAVGMVEDITERKTSDGERERLVAILEATPDFVSTANVNGRVQYFNKAGRQMLGIGEDEDISELDLHNSHPEWASALVANEGIPTAVREGVWHGETALLSRDGREIPVSQVIVAHRAPDGGVEFVSTIARDITERKEHEAQLGYLATHDPLTGMPNRRSLGDALKRTVASARRGRPSALLFLDIDNFKVVNDTLGHTVGDRALVAAAQLVQAQLREEDLLARLGGDEFAVLLEGANLEQAGAVAERLRREVERFTFALDGVSFSLSVSIGLVAVDGQQAADTLLRDADVAMYEAKDQGRNRVVLYRRKEEGPVARPDNGSMGRTA